jgi:hypothetical protein
MQCVHKRRLCLIRREGRRWFNQPVLNVVQCSHPLAGGSHVVAVLGQDDGRAGGDVLGNHANVHDLDLARSGLVLLSQQVECVARLDDVGADALALAVGADGNVQVLADIDSVRVGDLRVGGFERGQSDFKGRGNLGKTIVCADVVAAANTRHASVVCRRWTRFILFA